MGDGAELCHKALGYEIAGRGNRFQRGSSVAFLAEEKIKETEPIDGSELLPVYLRLPQAERELNNRLNNK